MEDIFLAFEAVRESGAYNMLDNRARKLAEEMNDILITKKQWIFVIQNYSELKEEFLKDKLS